MIMCRCNIPVVIMGETGCGKTRLIRYMCELAKQVLDVKNMFILKVCKYNVDLNHSYGDPSVLRVLLESSHV